MSLEKSIKYGKEHRKPYYGSKAFDKSCRNHGSCPYCQGSRQHVVQKNDPLRNGEWPDIDDVILEEEL